MDYRQISPDIVVRASDGRRVKIEDSKYQKWLNEGNSPFPPDPPVAEELDLLITAKSVE